MNNESPDPAPLIIIQKRTKIEPLYNMSAIRSVVRALLQRCSRRAEELCHADGAREPHDPDVTGRRDLQRIVRGGGRSARRGGRALRHHRLQFAGDRIVGAAPGSRQHAACDVRVHADAIAGVVEVAVGQLTEDAVVDLWSGIGWTLHSGVATGN